MTTHRPPVNDWHRLPEHTIYRDTGCRVAPSCLSCPLPACRFERDQRTEHPRRDEAVALQAQGLSLKQIAEAMGSIRMSAVSQHLALAGTRTPRKRRATNHA